MKKQEFIESLKYTKVFVDGNYVEVKNKLLELGFRCNESNFTGFLDHVGFVYITKDTFTPGVLYDVFAMNSKQLITMEYILNTKVEEECIKFKPFDRVLVRDYTSDEWKAGYFSHYRDSKTYPFSVSGIMWQSCIPYEGNEHLAGTTCMP